MKKRILLVLLTIFTLLFCSTKAYAENIPEIKGQAAITVDVDTGDIIYTKNIDARLYPASTTKLMTAIILAENNKKDDVFTYSLKAQQQESFTINFNVQPIQVGDKFKASDAMDAMLLCSANDMAYMIAENSCGGFNNFIKKMNEKASELKLKNTHFETPNGLPNSNHYSSAYDLSVIARQLYKYPWIMETLAKKSSIIKTGKGLSFKVKNTNKLLGEDGCQAGKTGFTDSAGRCLVELYERNGRKLVGVVLKSEKNEKDTYVFNDMEKIIDWSYSCEKKTIISKDSVYKAITAKYNLIPRIGPLREKQIPISVRQDIKKYDNDSEFYINYSINNYSTWKLDKNTPIGTITLKEREKTSKYLLYPDFSGKDLFEENKVLYISAIASIFLIILLLISSILLCKIYKRRRNRVGAE